MRERVSPTDMGEKKPWHAAAVSPSPPPFSSLCSLSCILTKFPVTPTGPQNVIYSIYILYIIKTLRQHDRPARVVVHTAATGLQPCPNIRKAACCCSGTIYYIYRTEAKGGVDDLGWQVWRLSGHHKERETGLSNNIWRMTGLTIDSYYDWQGCHMTGMTNNRFDKWQECRMTLMSNDRNVEWQVWQMTGMSNDRNVEWQECRMTGMSNGRSDEWQVWRMTGLTNDRSNEWQVWRMAGLTNDNSDEWQVWRMTSLTNDRSDELQVARLTWLTSYRSEEWQVRLLIGLTNDRSDKWQETSREKRACLTNDMNMCTEDIYRRRIVFIFD